MGARTTRAAVWRGPRRAAVVVATAAMLASAVTVTASAQDADPRIGLGGGQFDAEQVSENLEVVSFWDKRTGGLWNDATPTSSAYWISDMAYQGELMAMGNFYGFQLFDIGDPT